MPVTEMVSLPSRMRSSEERAASATDMMRISSPLVSWSFRYLVTFSMSWASWARFLSSQKTAGAPVIRARVTASFTQSRIGASFT